MIFRFFFWVLDLFYRRSHLGGKVPPSGPLVIVANHPNGLVDPIVVARVAGRPVKILGKEPVFRMPILGWLAKQVGAIPVYRPQDGHDTKLNRGAFDAVHAELAQGGAVLLFPEGISHNEPGLQKLKTGAARMALGAEALAGIPLGTKVVPVGVVYRSKTRFRSNLAVEIGEPVDVAPFVDVWNQNSKEGALALTNEIDIALREVMLDLERWEDFPILELATKILGDDCGHRVTHLRNLASQGKESFEKNPKKLLRLKERLAGFDSRLKQLGLSVEQLDAPCSPGRVAWFTVQNVVATLFGLPLAALGFLFWFPPTLLIVAALRIGKPEEDIVATVKVLGGCLFFPMWIGCSIWLSRAVFNLNSFHLFDYLMVFSFLGFSGIYGSFFFRRRREAWEEFMVLVRLLSMKRLRSYLTSERDSLLKELQGSLKTEA
ncbi:MAG: lysophospholipid acyltransferase family protein [Planctomycetota bacterium]|jgi:1-acyl-sn-glycerol-3-phosphate acyltransferase|nr:lysophospholipid acyltransferase family protein [Planctomycetota bacterium]MDP6940834.1 lysophospholipid acyltransferase family protein [Planctomycetota bacterium]